MSIARGEMDVQIYGVNPQRAAGVTDLGCSCNSGYLCAAAAPVKFHHGSHG
jgi:hypothetical protein